MPELGDVLEAESEPDEPEESPPEELLVEEFRRQLDLGLWAAVPIATPDGRRQARMVRDFSEIPRDADRVIFFPRAAGGA